MYQKEIEEQNMLPTISVIIPAYNAEKYIENTIESILNQTFECFEVICVNDGSKDKTLDVVQKFALADSRVRVYSIENLGVSMARNFGIDKARGEWIQFVDSDDTLEKNMMQTMLTVAEHRDLVVCSVIRENEKCRKREYQCVAKEDWIGRSTIGSRLLDMSDKDKDILLNYVWNKLFNTKIIKSHNLKFDPKIRLGEDFVFVCKYIQHCESITLINEPLYCYYLRNSGSLVSKFDKYEANRRIIMRDSLMQLFDSYDILTEGYKKVLRIEGRYCWISISKIKSNKNLSRRECLDYISSFLTDKLKECMILYCKENKSLKNFVKLVAIKKNNIQFLYMILK